MRHLEVNAFEGFISGIANSNSNWMQQVETCGIGSISRDSKVEHEKEPRDVEKNKRRKGK